MAEKKINVDEIKNKIKNGKAKVKTFYSKAVKALKTCGVTINKKIIKPTSIVLSAVNKKVYSKIENLMNGRLSFIGKNYSDFIEKTGDLGAEIVYAFDRFSSRVSRRIFIIQYHVAKALHEMREHVIDHKKYYFSHFLGGILILISVVTMFEFATAYEYSYNGRSLGYVKNQEDVTKILPLVSEELSKEHNSNIQIREGSNITFTKVVAIDKDIDNIDTVLNRLTYMSDMKAKAVGIYVDGKLELIVETTKIADKVLKGVQAQFIHEGRKTKYEEIGFAENVRMKYVNTKLSNIKSEKDAVKHIMSSGVGEKVYKVEAGDTVSEICSKLGVTIDVLTKHNADLDVNNIHIGQKIVLSTAVPGLTVKTVEVSTFSEKIEYKTKKKKTKDLYLGDTRVKRKGSDGKQVVTARLTKINGETVERDVLDKEIIKKAVSKIVEVGTNPVPPKTATGTLRTPVSGYTLTSYFGARWGRMHEGIDMACPTGVTIIAADGGTVSFSGWYFGYGYMVEIDHGSGMKTRYGHCNTLNVNAGEKVYKGQKIAEVGNTGNSYGSHLHFEVRINGTAVDPLGYI